MLKVISDESVLDIYNKEKDVFPKDVDKGTTYPISVENVYKFGEIKHHVQVLFTEKELARLRQQAVLFRKRFIAEKHYFETFIPIKESEKTAFFSCAECLFYCSLRDMRLIEALYYSFVLREIDQSSVTTQMAFARINCILFQLTKKEAFGEQCYEVLQQILKNDPKNRDALLLLSKLQYFQKKIYDAVETLFTLIRFDTADMSTIDFLCRLLLLLDYHAEMIELHENMINHQIACISAHTKPKTAETVYAILQGKLEFCLVGKAYCKGQFQEVCERTERYLRKNPDELRFIDFRMRALLQTKRIDEANKLAKKYKDVPLIQAIYYLGRGDHVNAFLNYKRFFAELGPVTEDYPLRIVFDLIEIWKSGVPHKLNDYALMLKVMNDTLKVEPGNLIVWEILAAVANSANFIQSQDNAARKCCELNPDAKIFYLSSLASSYHRLGQTSKCKLVIYEIMDELWQGKLVTTGFYDFNELTRQVDQRVLALDFFFQYFHRSPNEVVFILLASLYQEFEMMVELKELAELYLCLNPHSCGGHTYLALALLHAKEYERAIEEATKGLGGTIDLIAYQVRMSCHAVLKRYPEVVEDGTAAYKIAANQHQLWVFSKCVDPYVRALIEMKEHSKAKAVLKKCKKVISQRQFGELMELLKNSELPAAVAVPSYPIMEKTIQAPEPLVEKPVFSEPKIAPLTSDCVRPKEPKVKKHFQPVKGNVAKLNKSAIMSSWKNNQALTQACTFDAEIYGNATKFPQKPIKTLPVELLKPLTATESRRLELAKLSLVRLGDLLKQNQELGSSKFLYPRAIAYNLLKFTEALSPTSYNRLEITDLFLRTIQRHVISKKLIGNLRNDIRHHFHLINMDQLIAFSHQLVKDTVLQNIKAYSNAKAGVAEFVARATLPKKQQFIQQESIDYLKMVQMELKEMDAISSKISFPDIDANALYREGLKMAVCNVEECIRRLQIPEKKLGEIIYFGNKIAHEVGENPHCHLTEELSVVQLHLILNKVTVIRDQIFNCVRNEL